MTEYQLELLTPPLMEVDELERCPFCGVFLESPCESPPPDLCSKALESVGFLL